MSEVYGGFNVPFRKPQLIGRANAVEELHEALNQGEAAALTPALTGQGGIGKTQLAILYAYEKAPSMTVVSSGSTRANRLGSSRSSRPSLTG